MSDVETAVTSLGREVTRLTAALARVTGERDALDVMNVKLARRVAELATEVTELKAVIAADDEQW